MIINISRDISNRINSHSYLAPIVDDVISRLNSVLPLVLVTTLQLREWSDSHISDFYFLMPAL